MSVIGDLVEGIVKSAVGEAMRRVTGKRARRRRRRSLTASERLNRIEKLIRPARRKTSKKKTVATRSANQRKRVVSRTRSHRRSFRKGAARR